jgi:NHLM bacteriocin system ABC transporter peptidase/ATP-binding protein
MNVAFDLKRSQTQSLLRRLRTVLGRGRSTIRKTPTILQMEALECGAACLAMVLAFYGLWIPLEQLRVACGVSRDGSKAANVLKAARHFGLVAKGFRKEPATLHELPMPSIIHWNFNHFVVLEGLDRGRAYINDPAVGRRQIDVAEFDAAFTGVVLAMVPAAEFKKAGSKPKASRILLRELSGSKQAVALLIAISLALVVPGIAIPAFSKVFVDDILIQHANRWLIPLLIGMAVAAIARAIVTACQQSLLLRLETKLTVTMVGRFLWHVLALPMEFFTQRHAGDIANRIALNEQIARLLSEGLATHALNLVSLVFFAAVMVLYDPLLAAIGVGMSLMNVLAVKLIAQRRQDLSASLTLEHGKLLGSTIGAIRTIETIKASGLEDDSFAYWAGIQAKALNAEQDLGFYSAMLEMFPTLFSGLTMAAILGVGGLRVIEGALTLGGLVAFQSLMASFSGPITSLVQLAGSVQTINGGLARLEDVYNYPVNSSFRPQRPPGDMPPKLFGRLELKGVQFGYSAMEPPLIDGLSLALEPGMRIALVGRSGSGKSTVGRLVCGLCTPWAGEVRFDGWLLSDIPEQIFANSVAYVDQDIFLFEGTLRENLALWDASVSDIDISQALKDASIHDDVATRPGNYDCYVSEGGTNFSGGQRQRIEIARALVGNPSLIVFDEATGALDPVVEKEIDDNLRRRGCACIIIAHRLSTIRDCDEIIVLEQGKVAERGRHEELLGMRGAYARLISQE